jgi:hypothetical protein
MIRRFASGVALATGLTLSLTGCFGMAGDKAEEAGKNLKLTAAQVLGKTAEKTGQIDSFQADLSMQMTGSGENNMSMTGSMQYRIKPDLAYRMTFDQMTVAGQNMQGIEMLLVDRTMYMKMPMLSQLGGGSMKPWLRMSLDELGAESGVNIDELLQQSRQMDPIQNTKMLTASKDVREVGKETVNGVETTHYTGTYRMEEAIAKLPADQQEAVRKATGQAGMSPMNFDLWVDDQQLPRKMTMKGQMGPEGPMTMTMTYRDFGKPVQVTAPPAGQVTDFSKLMESMPGAGGTPGS